MIDSIAKEIHLTNLVAGMGSEVKTIYFGGGTPSLLSNEELQAILIAIRKKFTISDQVEITLEANPDDISATRLQDWKTIGINRLSTGIQSFGEAELKWMNRAHNAAEAAACIQLMKEAGFANFSIDLIYGSPLLDDAAWERTVQMLINQDIPHISCYALTVEPKTVLDKLIREQRWKPIDPERQARQFLLLMDWMKDAGYEHYEISNFAKPGSRSQHNSSYWQGKPYFGFGPSAHSYNGSTRKWNVANNALYIQSLQQDMIPFEEEVLTPSQQLNEYIMIALRTMEGVDLEKIKNDFGEGAVTQLLKGAQPWISGEKVVRANERLLLTKQGKLFADGIAADLFTLP